MNDWKLLTQPFHTEIRHVLQNQHLAAQYIAMTGRYLIPEKKDQDNITLQYLPDEEIFIGKQHPDGWLVSLVLRKLVLQIRDKNLSVTGQITLEGKTFPEVLLEFKKKLHDTGADVSLLRTEQPYELPLDLPEEGLFFSIGPETAVEENLKYRYNANKVLNSLRAGFKGTSPVYIWPNHFDTGFSFPVEHYKAGEISKTIGMGWAIPDDKVDEPYFYLSLHTHDELPVPGKPDSLPYGSWMMPHWHGAVLKLSELLGTQNPQDQLEMVKAFLETGVKRLTEHYKISH